MSKKFIKGSPNYCILNDYKYMSKFSYQAIDNRFTEQDFNLADGVIEVIYSIGNLYHQYLLN
jgi:hypothetical protein